MTQRTYRASSFRSVFLAAICLCLCIPSIATALEPLRLTLEGVVKIVKAQNLSIMAEDYAVAAYRAALLSEEGKYDPTLSFQLGHSVIGNETPSTLEPTEEESYRGDMSLLFKSPVGATYEFRLGTEHVYSDLGYLLLNPYVNTEVAFTVTRSLMRGAEDKTSSVGMRVARNNLEASRFLFDETVANSILQAVEAYWDLFFSRADLEVANRSLGLARNLLEEIQGRIRAGKLASIEIFKAEAELAKRQEALIRARKALGDSEDRLREIMNFTEWDREIVTLEEPPEPLPPPALDAAVKTALENRGDYRRALVNHQSKVEMRKYREGQKKPQLDFFAIVTGNSVEDQFKDTSGDAFSLDTPSWSMGLTYSRSLGGGEAEGQYEGAVFDEGRSRLIIEAVAQRVRYGVREARRNLAVSAETIDSTRVTRNAAEKQLLAEEEKFRVGKATLNDVLQFQAEYTEALSSERRARADYAIAIALLARETGTLLGSIP